MIGVIRRIRERGVTILIIEHLMQAIMSLSDRIVVLNFGEKLAEGTPAEVANDAAGDRGLSGRSQARRRAAEEGLAWPTRSLPSTGLEAGYGEVQVLWGISLERRPRPAHRDRRRQRRRQDHDVARDRRHDHAMARTGHVRGRGRDARCRPTSRRRRGFALVPEGRQLFSAMTVDENLRARRILETRRRAITPTASIRCSACFPGLPSGGARSPARCPAANSRCWRSPAA